MTVRGTRVKTDTHHFRSKFEASIYGTAKAARKQLDYEPKDALVRYDIHFRYLPDWKLPNGILVESKGRLDVWDRRKHLAIKEQHPHLDIRFLFQNSRMKISKAGMTYGEWATKHGFIYADSSIPLEWWKE